MNILIIHSIPFDRINYDRTIDHSIHDVVYFGKVKDLQNIPNDLRCRKIERSEDKLVLEDIMSNQHLSSDGVDRVVALSEYDLLDAAKLRAHLGVEGPTFEKVELVRDKTKMKRAVAAASIKTPDFRSISDAYNDRETIPWSGKTILKPVDGASSKDVQLFCSPASALQAVDDNASGARTIHSDGSAEIVFEIEEFIEGPISHYDGWVRHGRVECVVASNYVGTCLDYAAGSALGSHQRSHTKDEFDWIARVIAAVEIEGGCFHLEAINGPLGLCFLEIANRFGGAGVVQTFELATGAHLPSVELQLCLDPSARPRPDGACKAFFGWFILPGHAVSFDSWQLVGVEQFKDSPPIVFWHENHRQLPTQFSYHQSVVPLMIIASANEETELKTLIEGMSATLAISLK